MCCALCTVRTRSCAGFECQLPNAYEHSNRPSRLGIATRACRHTHYPLCLSADVGLDAPPAAGQHEHRHGYAVLPASVREPSRPRQE